ncbi:hypothetical protein DRJ25_03925 [Candidatus Woesearchaeota archaeon]|nr:MAG: hypothetical protein DRJ25_03925 [Candidatus Woesearchaeota archaeon]
MKHGFVVLGVIFVFGIFALVSIFSGVSTGDFTYGGNMGKYYAGGSWVQFQPVEACEFMGAHSFDPPVVFHSSFGNSMMVKCFRSNPNDERDSFAVPLVQWINAGPVQERYNPLG